MLYSIDYSCVLDLPEDPTPEDIVNALTQDLTLRPAQGALDGVVTVTPEEE